MSKFAQLVKRVHEQTKAGKIAWEPASREGHYQVDFPNYSIRYWKKESDYILTVYNESGTVIDRVSDVDLADEDLEWEPFEIMQETYESARAQALGLEKALDDILGYLDDE